MNSKIKKPAITLVFLVITAAISFLLPKPEYTSLRILEEISVPEQFGEWESRDMSEEVNLQHEGYNFVSGVLARVYKNGEGDEVLLLIVDAGNFHNPKVCFGSSGVIVKDLGEVDFRAGNKKFDVTALYMEKDAHGMFMFYWLCIDKKIVGWTGQKIMELWSSLVSKKKAGLMLRLQIPAHGRTPNETLALARDFVHTLSTQLSEEERDYLFGK